MSESVRDCTSAKALVQSHEVAINRAGLFMRVAHKLAIAGEVDGWGPGP